MFKLALFGGFQLTYQRQTIHLDHRPRIQSLLAFLALNRHRPQTRVDVIHALWPNVSESPGRNRLRNLLYQLRQILPAWEELILIKPTALQWRMDTPAVLDVARFETDLTDASVHEDAYQKELCLIKAADRYVGDLFPTCVEEWAAAPRARLRAQLIDALGQLSTLAEARQAWRAAHQYADRLLWHDPLHEATYCRIMQIQARLGDTASITRTYMQCCDVLASELAVEPHESTQRLYRQLTTLNAASGYFADHTPKSTKPTTLVGRNAEWAELHRLWQQVQDGDSRLVVIQGEAGIGKTRLYQDFLHWVAQQHLYVASASCYVAEGPLAFAPVAEWLRAAPFWQSLASLDDAWLAALARLLPELQGRFQHLSDSILPAESLQRQHFFTALAVALLEHGQPVLLCLDDLQWSDRETLDWLHYLIRYETPTPLLVLATLRTDDAGERARCQPLLRELQRHSRLTEILLTPLSIHDTTALAQQILGRKPYPAYAAQLYQETDGNPFFIVETVRSRPHAFLEPAAVSQTTRAVEQDRVHHLPPKICALIEERLARLSPLATEIMQFAAVIGRRFDYALLVATTRRREEELIDGMEELWAQQIVREAADRCFDFVHDNLRVVAYAQISPIRRRYLHKRIATTLASNPDESTDDACLQIAQHYVQAGELVQAADYYERAVYVASRRYAIESLLAASTLALELLQKLDPNKRDRGGLYKQATLIDERVWSWEMVGDMDAYLRDLALLKEIGVALGDEAILTREARFRAAALIRLGSYREAEAVAGASAQKLRAAGATEQEGISLTVMGRARRELGEYAAAVAVFRNALEKLERVNAHVYQIQAYSYLSTTYWQMGNYEAAFQCGQKALTICNEQNMPERKRFAWGDMGAAAAMMGQITSAQQWLHKSLRLAELVTDSPQKVFCRGHLGFLALRAGKYNEAAHQLETAYTLSQNADTINYTSWLLRGLAETAAATGQVEHAHALATQAWTIANSNRQIHECKAAQMLLEQLRA